jgi:hypothetical protein
MSVLLSDLARAADPRVVDICLVALVAAYLALMIVLVSAAIISLVSRDETRRRNALSLVRLLRWRGWGWHRDDGEPPG